MLQLYKNIKSKRKELGLSQEDLAKLTGYTDRTSISKVEAGKVNLSQTKITEFAYALKTTPGDLMGWELEKTSTGYTINDGEDEIEIELIDATKDLSTAQIRELINFAKFIKSEVDKDEKESKR